MVLPNDKKYPGRLVDTKSGQKVFAVACGQNICQGGVMNGRLVSLKDGRQLYVTASECCQPPVDPLSDPDIDENCFDPAEYNAELAKTPFLVEKDNFPPYGLSRVIRIRVAYVTKCADTMCRFAFLYYKEQGTEPNTGTGTGTSEWCEVPSSSGYWEGCVDGVNLILWIDPTKPEGQKVRVCFNECIAPDIDGRPIRTVTLQDPNCHVIRGTVTDISGGEGCCECPFPLFDFEFLSYCGPKRQGRFVAYKDGKKVYAIGDCCPGDPCIPEYCCAREGKLPSTLYLSAVGSGVCGTDAINIPLANVCECRQNLPRSPTCYESAEFTIDLGNGCSIIMKAYLSACSAILAGHEHIDPAFFLDSPDCTADTLGDEEWHLLIAFKQIEGTGQCPCGARLVSTADNGFQSGWACRLITSSTDPSYSCNPINFATTQVLMSIEPVFDPELYGEIYGGYECPPENVCNYQFFITEGMASIMGTSSGENNPSPPSDTPPSSMTPTNQANHPLPKKLIHSSTTIVRPTTVNHGPGTELESIFKSLGVDKWVSGCGGCRAFAQWMNKIGVDGCEEPKNREDILKRLRDQSKRLGSVVKVIAGAKLVSQGIIINPLDPAGSLLDLAIRRARTKQTLHLDQPNLSNPREDKTKRISSGKYTVNPVAMPKSVVQHKTTKGSRRTMTTESTLKTQSLKWAVGITTVPERTHTLLPKTIESLRNAGFDKLRLFVDGCSSPCMLEYERLFTDIDITVRNPRVRAYANWCLSLSELVARQPNADRFVIFQDDILVCKNLRPYLDSIPFPQRGYINLVTFWESDTLTKEGMPLGLVPAETQRNHAGQPKKPNTAGVSPQHGRGALGLVFDFESATTLLRSPHIIDRINPRRKGYLPDRHYRFIDGAVVTAMNNAGFTEYVHNPSLLQHNGQKSTITGRTWGPKANARSWRGENFDCLTLLTNAKGEQENIDGHPQ